ncbi:hypothetical protein IKF63_01175 [Candidatus Saccharibacteria bacterium]|nr:hypothetical protein [Candidatus Saccharibacteria bacterium]MBR3180675.1 hypothetical protein [Candidatus Saccharibacteria bacterium]
MISEDVYDELLAIRNAAEAAVDCHDDDDTIEAIRDIKRSLKKAEYLINTQRRTDE